MVGARLLSVGRRGLKTTGEEAAEESQSRWRELTFSLVQMRTGG